MCVEPTYQLLLDNKAAYNKRTRKSKKKKGKSVVENVCKRRKKESNVTHRREHFFKLAAVLFETFISNRVTKSFLLSGLHEAFKSQVDRS